MNIVFVYGTLMSGMGNSYLMKGEFMGVAKTVDKYSIHVSIVLPFLHDDESLYNVEGEVYSIDDENFEELDCLESNNYWYTRKQILVDVNGNSILAWAYFNNDVGSRVGSSYRALLGSL